MNEDLDYLRRYLESVKQSPWGDYVTLNYDEVVKYFEEEGLENTKDLIKQADIFAYRKEEFYNDNL